MLNVLPRDEKYFDQFNELSVRIHESAKMLARFFNREAPVGAVADQIKRLEHECDEISHQILRSIDRTFITPIDREDIHQLAVRLASTTCSRTSGASRSSPSRSRRLLRRGFAT